MVLLTLFLLIVGVILNQYVGECNFLFYRHGLIDCFFVAIGFYMKKNDREYNFIVKYAGFAFLVIMAVRFLHLCQPPIQDANIGVKLQTIPFFLLTTLSGSFSFLYLCKRINKLKFLEYFGRNSLIVYALHMWPYLVIIGFISKKIELNTQLQALLFIASVYFAELLCMYLAIEVLKTKYIRYLIGR